MAKIDVFETEDEVLLHDKARRSREDCRAAWRCCLRGRVVDTRAAPRVPLQLSAEVLYTCRTRPFLPHLAVELVRRTPIGSTAPLPSPSPSPRPRQDGLVAHRPPQLGCSLPRIGCAAALSVDAPVPDGGSLRPPTEAARLTLSEQLCRVRVYPSAPTVSGGQDSQRPSSVSPRELETSTARRAIRTASPRMVPSIRRPPPPPSSVFAPAQESRRDRRRLAFAPFPLPSPTTR